MVRKKNVPYIDDCTNKSKKRIKTGKYKQVRSNVLIQEAVATKKNVVTLVAVGKNKRLIVVKKNVAEQQTVSE